MKAIVYDRPGNYTLAEVPRPTPGPADVLIRVVVAGVCGTDLHLHDGEFGPTYPLTPGHEIAGEVVEVGAEVEGVVVGDLVTFDNTAACGHCDECRRARPAFCRHLIAQGVNAPGGFAEYVVTRADRCFVVNDLDPEVAVFAEPTACVIHGLDVLAMQPGADVLLFGAGPTGLLLTQMLRNAGAGWLTVVAPTESKLRFAAEHGADHVIQVARGQDVTGELLARTGGVGYDIVSDATGALPVLAHTVELTRTGGTVFVYGMTAEAAELPILPYEVFRRELTIKGSFAQQFSFDRSVAALRAGRVQTDGMVTHRFDLEHYADALKAVADSGCIKAVIRPDLGR
jgi:D-arabinitol dehydrogenase (NADP+)